MDKIKVVKGWLDFANKEISCAKHLLACIQFPWKSSAITVNSPLKER